MVTSKNGTKLFTPKNISKFAKTKAKLLYAILSEAIPGTDNEYSTIGLALTPEDAFDLCRESMGEAIEVWVVDGDRGLLSEKWEPEWFNEHFKDVVEYTTPIKDEDYEERLLHDSLEENDPDSNDMDERRPGIGIEMPQEIALGKSLLEILECEQEISKIAASTSFATGHPMDIQGLLTAFHESIANILKAFATTKGGFEPKFRKKDGIAVPYWTKTQIKQAKLKG